MTMAKTYTFAEAFALAPADEPARTTFVQHLITEADNTEQRLRDAEAEVGKLREDVAVLGGMILDYHDRSHGAKSIDECAARLCTDYVVERNATLAPQQEETTT